MWAQPARGAKNDKKHKYKTSSEDLWEKYLIWFVRSLGILTPVTFCSFCFWLDFSVKNSKVLGWLTWLDLRIKSFSSNSLCCHNGTIKPLNDDRPKPKKKKLEYGSDDNTTGKFRPISKFTFENKQLLEKFWKPERIFPLTQTFFPFLFAIHPIMQKCGSDFDDFHLKKSAHFKQMVLSVIKVHLSIRSQGWSNLPSQSFLISIKEDLFLPTPINILLALARSPKDLKYAFHSRCGDDYLIWISKWNLILLFDWHRICQKSLKSELIITLATLIPFKTSLSQLLFVSFDMWGVFCISIWCCCCGFK